VNQATIIQAFTELAPRYEETVDWEVKELTGLGYREFIRYLAGSVLVVDNLFVLDIASGTAISSIEISKRIGSTGRVIGLDITPAMMRNGVENIKQSGLGIQITQVCGSAMEMPFNPTSFDTVICGLGTHHMDVPRLLSETKRVLKYDGQLIMADMGAPMNWRSWWGRIAMRTVVTIFRTFWPSARAQAEASAFESIRTAVEWRKLLTSCGFGQVQVTEWPARRFWYPCALIVQAVYEAPS
jgi:ubiquinone/menaquinone biosynthesis C-methylase UbiE